MTKKKGPDQDKYDLEWPPLVQGQLMKRYQRFKADVKLRNGHVVTALCPNTGSMLACSEPGRPVYLSRQNKPGRRLKYTWEMIEMPTSLVGVNTWVPNQLVKNAILNGKIKELSGYETIRREVTYGHNSRIDLLLEKKEERCFVEIKNCTLTENGTALFPDAVTSRGLKHLSELQRQVGGRNRCVMFYLVQRMDAERFMPAHKIDPTYGKELKQAEIRGVEILVYDVLMDLEGVSVNKPIPYRLE
jgi:sugar fermentation stimulation protein A